MVIKTETKPMVIKTETKQMVQKITNNISNKRQLEFNILTIPPSSDIAIKKLNTTSIKNKVTILCGCYRDIEETMFKSLTNIKDDYELIILIDENPHTSIYDYIVLKKIISKYNLNNNTNILYSKINRGVYTNYNLGLLYSTGEYVITVSMDEIINKHLIKSCLEKKMDVVFYKYVRHSLFINYEIYNNELTNNIGKYGHSMNFYKKNIINIIGFYDNCRVAGDTNFVNRIKNKKYNIKYIYLNLLGGIFFGANCSTRNSNERLIYSNNTNVDKKNYALINDTTNLECAYNKLFINYSFAENLPLNIKYTVSTYFKQKIKILVVTHNTHFIENILSDIDSTKFEYKILSFKPTSKQTDYILTKLKSQKQVNIYNSTIINESELILTNLTNMIENYDIIFCEWFHHNVEIISHIKMTNKILIVRLHAYEVYKRYINTSNINNIDYIIVVHDWYKTFFQDNYNFRKVQVIDNYYKKYKKYKNIKNRFKNIGIVGVSSISKKRVYIALKIFKLILNIDSTYKLYIKGDIDYDNTIDLTNTFNSNEQNDQIVLTRKLIQDINNKYNGAIIFCKHDNNGGESMEKYYNNIGYLISCSLYESFHCVVMEAGSTGCIPIVYNDNKYPHLPNVPTKHNVVEFDTFDKIVNFILNTKNIQILSSKIEQFYNKQQNVINDFERLFTTLYTNKNIVPKATMIMPLYNSNDKFNIIKHSINQISNINWELVIAQEDNKLKIDKNKIFELFNNTHTQCVCLKFINIKEWIPLSAKYLIIFENISHHSICSLFSASDDFFYNKRIEKTYNEFHKNKNIKMYTNNYGFYYNFESKKFYGYSKQLQSNRSNAMSLEFAFSNTLISTIKVDHLRFRWVDSWLYNALFKDNIKYDDRISSMYYKTIIDDDTYNSLMTDGINNISVGRDDLMIQYKPPFYKLTDDDYNKLEKIWNDKLQNINFNSNIKINNNTTLSHINKK